MAAYDVIIVGGGIGGSALATALAEFCTPEGRARILEA